jgi:Cof subfamily protein (haloacid dehalogenase superfamily)
VVADIDGTLIARGTTATPVVADAVAEAHAGGLRVGFATGRLPVGVRELQGQLRPEGPHIVHNGAQIVADDGQPIRTWPLEREPGRQLVELCLERRLYAEFFVADELFVTDLREAARPMWDQISGEPDGLVEELDLDEVQLVKSNVMVFEADELPGVLTAIRRIGLVAEPSATPVLPNTAVVNVTSPEADKGSGLIYVAGHLGISLAEVVAVGDGPNDLSMLAVAGTAIAMGQAPSSVCEAAHVVVPEVEADGVAHALRAAAAWQSR